MSNENLFGNGGEQTPPVQPNPPQSTAPTVPDSLKELVGEGKKYATVEKALEALPHAQAHILRLEQEAAELRKKAEQAQDTGKMYEMVQELLKQRETATPNAAPLDEQALEALLDRKLTAREQEQVATRNAEHVREALKGKFGEKAQEVFESRAKELGVGVGFLTDLAKKSPAAALKLMGVESAPASAPSPTKGTVNTAALSNQQQPPAAPKVMGGATTQEILSAWRAAKPQS